MIRLNPRIFTERHGEVENIQPKAGPDIVTAVIPGLIMSDTHAADGISMIARDMRIIAAPKHPGRDPVSVHVVNELVSVLRGDGGFAPRLAALTERLRGSAEKLDAAYRQYQSTDQDAATAFQRIEHRP